MSFGRASLSVLAASTVAGAAALATAIVTARVLGPEGRGEFTVATLVAALAAALGNLGLTSAAAYYTAQRPRLRATVVGASLAAAFGVGVALVATLLFSISVHDGTFGGTPDAYFAVAVVGVPFVIVGAVAQNVFLGLSRFREFNAIAAAQGVAPLLLIAVALLLLDGGTFGAIVATTAGAIALAVVSTLRCAQVVGVSFRRGATYVRSALSYGLRSHTANVFALLGYRVDVFLVNAYAGSAAVGVYSIAFATAERLWLISAAAGTVVFARIAAGRDERERRDLTPIVARAVVVATAAAAVALALLGGPIIELLFSYRFRDAVEPLWILLPGIVVYGGARVLANDIAARGKPLLNGYVAGASVVLNVGLNFALIPRYGVAGAALSSTVSYGCLCAGVIAVYCRVSGNRLRRLLIPGSGDVAAVRRSLSRSG